MNILLAEDDRRLGELVSHMLQKRSNYKVDWVTNGSDVFEYTSAFHYDFIILDWMMPEVNGIDVCRSLRKIGYLGGIIMLTAKDSLENRIEGLDSGADDYIVKPFEFEELFARIRALSRRNLVPIKEEILQIKDLSLNRTNHSILYKGNNIQLTTREFQLFNFLVENRGQVLTRDLILDRIWGHNTNVTNNAIDAYIKLIRKKIDPSNEKTLIQSIRGVGYRFDI